MSVQHLTKLIHEGKRVSFYLSPTPHRGKYVCDVDIKDDEHLVYADTVEELLRKLERKEFSGTLPSTE
jgi:hypothetical protein